LKKAFTLIELLVVIAIIAILAAILFPVFARAKEAAKATAEMVQAQQIGLAGKLYLGDNDDTMPIYYEYNSVPPAGQTGHKGVEVELAPYCKSTAVFKSPFDSGGPYTSTDVPGATTYWQAYGSSFRFTQCMYTIASGESTQNNIPYTFNRVVSETQIELPSESRAMRLEIFPFFAKSQDIGCAHYGYDCDAPNNYYRPWSSLGGSVIFTDSHAKHVTAAGQFDATVVDPAGHKSGEADPDPAAWSGTWYSVCD
jgi:prepilin-type N-terminal cleavage/methylation domain-containing protein